MIEAINFPKYGCCYVDLITGIATNSAKYSNADANNFFLVGYLDANRRN